VPQTLHNPALLRAGHYRFVTQSCCAHGPAQTSLSRRSPRCCSPCSGVRRMRLTHALALPRRVSDATLTATLRHPASLRPCRTIHSPAFSRSDEILYLVEKDSDLTLPDSVRSPFPGASSLAASALEISLCPSLQGFTLAPRRAADSYCIFPRLNQHFALPSPSTRARNSWHSEQSLPARPAWSGKVSYSNV